MLDPAGGSATFTPKDLVTLLVSRGERGREFVTTAGRHDKAAQSESFGVVAESCRDPMWGVAMDS